MENNTEAYCPNCKEMTLHIADIDGWYCDDCDQCNDSIFQSPYKDEY
ncbi:hypothetical protein PDJ99_25920 [Bacillus cereus]|nr:hypothetical protein [Bacillus cereus]